MELLKKVMVANMQSSFNIELLEDEYKKDDKIYCKNCNTPRTTIISPFGEERVVRCLCSCEAEKRDKEAEKQKYIEEQLKMQKLKDNSLMGRRYQNVSFENCMLDNPTFKYAHTRAKKYCENYKDVLENGYGLYIWGDKGTGKTHLTACMANYLMSKYKQVLFTNFFEISKSIRNTFNGKGNETDLINKIADIDFLFIDDLGTERVTNNGEDNWLQEKIFEVINKRYNNMKPTIFTSNYSVPQLINERGLMDKTADRIIEMSTAILKLEGRSNRAARKTIFE